MNLKIDILFAFVGICVLLFIYLLYAVRAAKKVAESQNAEIKADEKTITNTDAKVSDTIQQVNQLKNTAFIAGHGVRQVSTLLVNTEKLKSLSDTGIDCDDDFNVLGNLTAYNFYGIDQTVNNWNATTNNPTLINNDATHADYVYYVNVAGTRFGITFSVGDYLIYDDSGVISKRTVSLGYTPENVDNKAVNFSVINDTLYPSVNAVQNQLLSIVNGLNWKHSVLYSTTTSENLSLTGLTATVDGSVRTLLVTDRILVKNQTDGKQNGIYNPNSSTWTRTLDANTNDLLTAATVYVISGTAEINRVYAVNSVVNIGVSNVTFALIAGVGTYTNGTYLSLTGNIFDVNITQLRVNLDTVYSLFSDTRIFRGDDTGAADAITVTVTPTYNAYTDKDVFYVKVLHANATTTPTINISGKGAVTIVKKSGNALLVGDIQVGYYIFMYDRNTSQVHLMSPSLESTANLPDFTDKRYCTDAQKVVIANTSGINTGDQTLTSLGAAPLRPVTEKTLLVDADETTGNDSANSFSQIRTTWTNVKSFLKTYFDTIYSAIGHNHSGVYEPIDANLHAAAPDCNVDGGGAVINTGIYKDWIAPYSGICTGWTALGNVVIATADLTVAVYEGTYANFAASTPPVAPDIFAGHVITISVGQIAGQVTGLSIAITAGKVYRFVGLTATSTTKLSISLQISKT